MHFNNSSSLLLLIVALYKFEYLHIILQLLQRVCTTTAASQKFKFVLSLEQRGDVLRNDNNSARDMQTTRAFPPAARRVEREILVSNKHVFHWDGFKKRQNRGKKRSDDNDDMAQMWLFQNGIYYEVKLKMSLMARLMFSLAWSSLALCLSSKILWNGKKLLSLVQQSLDHELLNYWVQNRHHHDCAVAFSHSVMKHSIS